MITQIDNGRCISGTHATTTTCTRLQHLVGFDKGPAFRLFNASKGKETTIDQLEDFITVLENANSTAVSYKMIVKGLDADDTMCEHKKEDIQMKARYLAQASRCN